MDPSTMDYRQWDRLMKAQRAKETAPVKKGAAPSRRQPVLGTHTDRCMRLPSVYASVAVVGDAKGPSWLEDDDVMAWGDDRLPANVRGA
jgi:hypothetical protein